MGLVGSVINREINNTIFDNKLIFKSFIMLHKIFSGYASILFHKLNMFCTISQEKTEMHWSLFHNFQTFVRLNNNFSEWIREKWVSQWHRLRHITFRQHIGTDLDITFAVSQTSPSDFSQLGTISKGMSKQTKCYGYWHKVFIRWHTGEYNVNYITGLR